jgi:uncharacterized membrane protein
MMQSGCSNSTMHGCRRAFPRTRGRLAPGAMRFALLAAAGLALQACHGGGRSAGTIGEANDPAPYSGIAPGQTVHFTGTEPFWGGEVSGTTLIYKSPDRPEGERIAVARFAGRGGVSWSGTYKGARLVLAATPSECSDGMSDRTYPFVATLALGDEQRHGCAWTDRQPFKDPAKR